MGKIKTRNTSAKRKEKFQIQIDSPTEVHSGS
jgi:hypothetical protein